jgi:two-component system nitrogen regulation response regulator GlnG
VVLMPEAEARLTAWDWPGNVRELRNALQHALAASAGGPIHAAHLPAARGEPVTSSPPAAEAGPQGALEALATAAGWGTPGVYGRVVGQLERYLIVRALGEAGGNQVAASAHLGLHRNTLRRKLQELGLEPGDRAG